MKKLSFILLTCFWVALSFAQEKSNKAFYIYRNDGDFNAFIYSTVDSITYSSFDVDNVEQNKIVTQEIWTADSVYRIPLSVIDSVSLTKPETIYKANIIRLDSSLRSYIIATNEKEISFRNDTPESILPRINDIFLCEDFCDLFPEGYAGRVVEEKEGNVFVCDTVCFEDVYEQILIYDEYVVENAEDNFNGKVKFSLSSINAKTDKTIQYIPLDGEIGIEADNVSLSIKGNISPKISALIRKMKGQPVFINIAGELDLNINAKTAIEIGQEQKFNGSWFTIIKGIPIPNCPMIQFKLRARSFLDLKGFAELDADLSYSSKLKFIVRRNDTENIFTHSVSDVESELTANMELNGSVFAGFTLYPYFTCIADMFKVGIKAEVGPKVESKFKLDINDIISTDVYDSFKESKIYLSADAILSAEAGFNIKKKEKVKPLGSELKFSIPLREWYIFPEFSIPEYKEGTVNHNVEISTIPSRDVFMPIQIGICIVDSSDGISAEYKFEKETYRIKGEWTYDKLSKIFYDLKPCHNYFCYPMVMVLGKSIFATPYSNFTVLPKIETHKPLSVTDVTATVSGYSDAISNYNSVADIGICYSKNVEPLFENSVYVSSGQKTNGNFNVVLSGLTENSTYYYRTCLLVDGKYYYGEILSFTTTEIDYTPTVGEIVDLGLSVKWASCNVGASSPEEFGGYYAWGETEEKDYYDYETYKWCEGTWNSYTKYGNDSSYGIVDNKMTLDLSDDVAHIKLGKKWRIPTVSELHELYTKCTRKWIKVHYTYNGSNYGSVVGMLFVGPNGNRIILPTGGEKRKDYIMPIPPHFDKPDKGCYPANSLYSSNKVEGLWFDPGPGISSGIFHDGTRHTGCNVRPVWDETLQE